jgi:uroporphyrinogen decarboxylase
MTEREIMLNTMRHKGNPDNITPYSVGFDSWELQEKVNKYYGGNWRDKIRHFINTPFWMSTTREVAIEGRAGHNIDVFGTIWRTDSSSWHIVTPALPEPTFKDFKFPTIGDFIQDAERENRKKAANEQIEQKPQFFNIISMGWGIFEQTWRIRGFEDTMSDVVLEQDFYAELVDKLADLYVGMVEYCSDVKADAFLFGDDWGSQKGVIIGPEKWRKFIKPAWKRVYDKVHEQGKYVISHSCGSVYDIIPDAIEIGLDMLESVQPEAYGMNPFELKKEFGDKMGFWGTLGSQSVIPFWKPEEITEHIRKLKREMNVNGGYILAPAKPFQPETPLENAIAVIEALIEDN